MGEGGELEPLIRILNNKLFTPKINLLMTLWQRSLYFNCKLLNFYIHYQLEYHNHNCQMNKEIYFK